MAINQQTLEKLQHFPLHPVASETGTFTGATTNIADLKDYDGDIQVILDAGAAAASGTMTGKIQHSSTTTSGDFEDVTGGCFTAVAQAASTSSVRMPALATCRRWRGSVRRQLSLVSV